MDQFIQCLCHDNLHALVLQGEAKAEDLAEAWTNLFYEYCDLLTKSEVRQRAMMIAEMNLNKKKIELGSQWVSILKVMYSPNIAAAIKHIGFDYDLDPEQPEQLAYDLNRICGELSLMRLHQKIKEAELMAMAESTHGDTVDEKYFSTVFFRINNYARREAVNGQTFVKDYCAALRDYEAYIDNANSKSTDNAGI